MGALYRINFENGKSYIGITSRSVARRMALHRNHAKDGRDCALHRAMRKYGVYHVETMVIADDWDYLCDLERRAIAAFGTMVPGGYNLTAGGEGAIGYRWSAKQRALQAKRKVTDETKGKISASCRGYRHTEEAKAKISAAGRGRVFSAERKAKIGATKIGNRYNVGRIVTAETKARISLAQKGKPRFTDEQKQKMSKERRGKPWTTARRFAYEASREV